MPYRIVMLMPENRLDAPVRRILHARGYSPPKAEIIAKLKELLIANSSEVLAVETAAGPPGMDLAFAPWVRRLWAANTWSSFCEFYGFEVPCG